MPSNDLDSTLYRLAGQQYGIDPLLLQAVSQVETGGEADPSHAVSPQGAVGRMQIMPATATGVGVTDPTNDQQSIPGAARYLMEGYKATGSPEGAVMYYHGGPNQAQWGPKTQAYLGKVSDAYRALKAQQPQPGPTQATDRPPDDAMAAAWGIAPGAASASTAPQRPADADMAKAWGVGTLDAPKAAAAASEPPTAQPAQAPSLLDKVWAGANRFTHDVLDTPAELLARGADAVGLTPLMGAPSGPQTAAADTAARESFDRNYGNSLVAQGARAAGDIAATALPVGAAGRVIEGAGNALLGSGNMLARGLTSAASGATQGAVGAGLTAGASNQPIGQQVLQGAELGGAFGAALPAATAIGSGVRNALVGGGTPGDVARLAQTARDTYGIPVTGGQISTSPAVRFLDSVTKRLPFSGASEAGATQQTAFNRAVASTFGENATKITPDVMAAAKGRLGQTFDDIAGKTTVQADDQLLSDLGRIQSEAQQVLPASEQVPISSQLTNVLDAAAKGDGAISGESYQALTRKGSPLDRAMQSSDPNVRFYAGQVRDSLDNALQRSAPQQLQDQLTQARSQYKAMKTVEDLVEKSPTGDISPALLMNRVRSSYGNMAYDGGGQLGDLARIGQQFMKEPASSGTAERNLLHAMLFEAPAAFTGNPLLGAKIAGGLAAGRAAGSVLRSNFYTNMLIHNSLGAGSGPLNRLIAGVQPYAAGAGQIAAQRGLFPLGQPAGVTQ